MPTETHEDKIKRLLANDEKRKESARKTRLAKVAAGEKRYSVYVPGDLYEEFAKGAKELLKTLRKSNHSRLKTNKSSSETQASSIPNPQARAPIPSLNVDQKSWQ